MDRVFSQFFGGQGFPGVPSPLGEQGRLQPWSPSVDVSQTDREWCIEVDLPGVKKDDIEAHVQDHHLILRAEMRQEERPQPERTEGQPRNGGEGQAGRQYHQRERRYGYFQRVLPLPENVDEDRINCDFRDGVLTIHLPKSEQSRAQGRRIPVGAGGQQTTAGQGSPGSKSLGSSRETGAAAASDRAISGTKGGETATSRKRGRKKA